MKDETNSNLQQGDQSNFRKENIYKPHQSIQTEPLPNISTFQTLYLIIKFHLGYKKQQL